MNLAKGIHNQHNRYRVIRITNAGQASLNSVFMDESLMPEEFRENHDVWVNWVQGTMVVLPIQMDERNEETQAAQLL